MRITLLACCLVSTLFLFACTDQEAENRAKLAEERAVAAEKRAAIAEERALILEKQLAENAERAKREAQAKESRFKKSDEIDWLKEFR